MHFGAFSGPHEALAELLDKPLRILKEDCWWEPRRIGGLRGFIEWLGMYRRPPAPSNSAKYEDSWVSSVHTKKSDTPGSDYCDWVYPNQRSWKQLQQNEQNDLRFGFWRDWNFSIVASDLIHDAILEHSPEMCGFIARNSLHACYLIHTDVPHRKVLQLLQVWKLWASVYPTIAPFFVL